MLEQEVDAEAEIFERRGVRRELDPPLRTFQGRETISDGVRVDEEGIEATSELSLLQHRAYGRVHRAAARDRDAVDRARRRLVQRRDDRKTGFEDRRVAIGARTKAGDGAVADEGPQFGGLGSRDARDRRLK